MEMMSVPTLKDRRSSNWRQAGTLFGIFFLCTRLVFVFITRALMPICYITLYTAVHFIILLFQQILAVSVKSYSTSKNCSTRLHIKLWKQDKQFIYISCFIITNQPTSSYFEILQSTTTLSAGGKDQFPIQGVQHHGTTCLELSVSSYQKFCYHHHFQGTSEKTELFSAAYDSVSAAGASDLNSWHMALPINVFNIWHRHCIIIGHTITVLELPPSESCNSLVSLEFRYGMCWDFPSTRAEMTLPRVERDKFIFVASFNRWPVAPVFDCRSDPYHHIKLHYRFLTWPK